MVLEIWLAFIAASAVVLVIPGPTILTVISYSVSHGRRANIPLVAAVALGDSTALIFSLFGLGALLGASALWFTVLKLIGGLYLLFVVLATINATLYATFATSARRLPCSPRAQRRYNIAGGSLLSAAGIWALLARRFAA